VRRWIGCIANTRPCYAEPPNEFATADRRRK
jgi:hypothetical protein